MRLTFDQYQRMVANGAFDSLRDRRIELIHGKVHEIPPPTPKHCDTVSWLIQWSTDPAIKRIAKMRIQNPIGIPTQDSAPQPDVAWVRIRSYRDRHPLPAEVLLLIEVADSSVASDCAEKAELYATACIQDYWVVSLPERLVHVFRQPTGGVYLEHWTVGMGEELRSLACPDYALSIAELLGP